jgi:murein DD-endopeptidase MepM/ murein hydrolase activator NlpD
VITVKRRILPSILMTAATAAAGPGGQPSPRSPLEASMPVTADDVGGVLSNLGNEDSRVSERLARLAAEAPRVHALLLARGRAYVKMARAGLLPIGGGMAGLVEHASRLERLRRALERDVSEERTIATERVRLSARHASFEEKRTSLEAERAALDRSRMAILAAQDREEAFRRAFLGNDEPHTAVYGSGIGPLDPAELSVGFSAQKGKLPFPIEGRAEIRTVRRDDADGPGLEMAAAEGAAVRAVYPGRVAFADAYADYGRAIILDHGSGYYTVSGNLGSMSVTVGKEVAAGAFIGTVGRTAKGASLYFEIRRGTTTLDPSRWFGI